MSFFRIALIGKMLYRSPFPSSKSVHIIVQVRKELEDLLGPEDVDVDFMRIMKEARDERGREIFETFSTDGLSDFLVAEWSRWDTCKRAPWRQDSSASAS